MLAVNLTNVLVRLLQRPDLRIVAGTLVPTVDIALSVPFHVTSRETGYKLVLGPPGLDHPGFTPTILRHAIELTHLVRSGIDPVLASFVAARVGALFHALDRTGTPGIPTWLSPFASPDPPDACRLIASWPILATLLCDPPPLPSTRADAIQTQLARIWDLLAPAETLMSSGGDSRLIVDPVTGLNRYACSHRPRPWAVTFGSSTASSLSERGFEGAERARRTLITDLLLALDPKSPQDRTIRTARQGIARHYALDPDTVILTASGTDCELAALAVAIGPHDRPVTNILIAPDETGSGVPLAARGRNFDADSACASTVEKGNLVEGFTPDVRLLGVMIRHNDGTPRPLAEIDAECAALVRQQAAEGRHVLLHRLDQSKTGISAPSMAVVQTLRTELGDALSIVIDACQARLHPARISDWVRGGMMVMITGSKFFTGPPFCGALLLPPTCRRTLARHRLPRGLRNYSNRSEWPASADASALNTGHNIGLALRWHAALAEMDALFVLPDAIIQHRLQIFMKQATILLSQTPAVTLLPVAPLPDDGRWDAIPTILAFLVSDPRSPARPLTLEDARRLHRWLNADLSPWIDDENAALMCVLGQPVPIAHNACDTPAGALRLCAGARLVSGEPSHDGMGEADRLAHEITGARRVLEKLGLILRHWDILLAADPVPRYAPGS